MTTSFLSKKKESTACRTPNYGFESAHLARPFKRFYAQHGPESEEGVIQNQFNTRNDQTMTIMVFCA